MERPHRPRRLRVASDKSARMSNRMARITARIPDTLERRLRVYEKMTGKTTSEAIRDALDGYLENGMPTESFYDHAKRLGAIGCAKGLPGDLSTNPKQMEDFGK